MIRDGSYQKRPTHGAGAAAAAHTNRSPSKRQHQQQQQRPSDFSERAFLEYFFQQTGLRMSPSQRRELVYLHYTRIPGGGRYDGPSWDIARRLAAEQDVFLGHATVQERENLSQWWMPGRMSHGRDDDNSGEEANENAHFGSNTVRRKRRR
jgi:hypothetical protein